MCKHTQVLEAMRTAVVTASKYVPSQELGAQIVAYEALLDDHYAEDYCGVCCLGYREGGYLYHETERMWMDKVLATVSSYVKARQEYLDKVRLAPWERELLGL